MNPVVASADRPAAWVQRVMGLPVSVHVRPGTERGTWAAVERAVDAAYDELHEVDRVLSLWRADSDLSRVAAGELAVRDAHRWVAEVVELCEVARQATGGAFDHAMPGPDGRPRLDPTGLVKGWAVDRAALWVRDAAGDCYVNAGGDLLVAAESGRPWRVGVEDPVRGGIAHVLAVTGGAVATSGLAARGDHVRDPRTGRPPRGVASVTVVGPSLTWADAYATAALSRGPEAGEALDRWLGGHPGHPSRWTWLVLDADGRRHGPCAA